MSTPNALMPLRSAGIVTDDEAHMIRRHFLKALGGIGVMLGLGGLAEWVPGAKARAQLVRPPGGQDESHFVSLCLKCNRCEEVCPTNVVGLADVRDGAIASRTPKLRFEVGYCTFCMKCIDVCPTNALVRVDKKRAKIGVAVVQKNSCIPWQWGGCTKCYERCPVKAINLDEQKRPVVDEVKCNGCGLCELICPATELRSYVAGQQRGILIVPPARGMGKRV